MINQNYLTKRQILPRYTLQQLTPGISHAGDVCRSCSELGVGPGWAAPKRRRESPWRSLTNAAVTLSLSVERRSCAKGDGRSLSIHNSFPSAVSNAIPQRVPERRSSSRSQDSHIMLRSMNAVNARLIRFHGFLMWPSIAIYILAILF